MSASNKKNTDYEFGGVLAPDSSGNWHIYKNATHFPIGLKSVVMQGDKLIVNYEQPLRLINWSAVTAHRTMEEQGISCGTSIGLTSAVISCMKNGSPVQFKSIHWENYIWIYIKGQI